MTNIPQQLLRRQHIKIPQKTGLANLVYQPCSEHLKKIKCSTEIQKSKFQLFEATYFVTSEQSYFQPYRSWCKSNDPPATWLKNAYETVFSNLDHSLFFPQQPPTGCISTICITRHLAPCSELVMFKLLISHVEATIKIY